MGTYEKFDIVNGSDMVTSFVYGKENLHNQPLGNYHRSIHILIEVVGGRFITQLKAEGTENAGKLSSAVSGHVRSGETYVEAAIREAKEELGLEIEPSELEHIAKISPCKETNNEFTVLYTYLLDDDTEQIKIDKVEVKEVFICKLDVVTKDVYENPDDYSPAFIALLNIFLELYKV